MATAEHTPAIQQVTVPESFNLSLSRDEARAIVALCDNTTGNTYLGSLAAQIGVVLRAAGIREHGTRVITRDLGYSGLHAITIKEN